MPETGLSEVNETKRAKMVSKLLTGELFEDSQTSPGRKTTGAQVT